MFRQYNLSCLSDSPLEQCKSQGRLPRLHCLGHARSVSRGTEGTCWPRLDTCRSKKSCLMPRRFPSSWRGLRNQVETRPALATRFMIVHSVLGFPCLHPVYFKYARVYRKRILSPSVIVAKGEEHTRYCMLDIQFRISQAFRQQHTKSFSLAFASPDSSFRAVNAGRYTATSATLTCNAPVQASLVLTCSW